MHIYTRKGDKGKTTLFGGETTEKDDIRIEACGTVDETNTLLGIAIVYSMNKEVKNLLLSVQNDLFTLQAELATQSAQSSQAPCITEDHIMEMEHHIDRIERQLPEQRKFILPGGTSAGAFLQLARSVSRRAERRIVSLHKKQELNPYLCQYINRLSDMLHLLSRLENKTQEEKNPTYTIIKEKEEQRQL